MIESLEGISFLDLFWFSINASSFSFGFKGLPPQIHYTIGYDEKSQDYNLHLTKEIPAGVAGKPKITILKFNKKMGEEIEMASYVLNLLAQLTEPVHIHKLRKKAKGRLWFIASDKIDRMENFDVLKQLFLDNFKDNIQVKKKKRIKIKGDIETGFKKSVHSQELLSAFTDNATCFSWNTQCSETSGTIIGNGVAISAFRMFGEWRTMKTGLTKDDLLNMLVRPELTRQISWKIKRALVILRTAESYADTEHANQSPILLQWIYETPE